MCYLGDVQNNVTYDIMRGCALLGMECMVSGPEHKDFEIHPDVISEIKEISKSTGAKVSYTPNPEEAVKNADVVYTDSWMSYHISAE